MVNPSFYLIWLNSKLNSTSNPIGVFLILKGYTIFIEYSSLFNVLTKAKKSFGLFTKIFIVYLKVKEPLTGQEILKTYAIARILLDNIPNIKAYWATSTVKLALIAQEFGANDVDGTIEKESIQSAAGASSANGIAQLEFVDLIKNSGFIPVERDSVYNEIKTW